MHLSRVCFIFLSTYLLLNCANTHISIEDGGPDQEIDLSHVEDAIPQEEVWARYGNHSPYFVLGETYEVLDSNADFSEEGIASWYGTKFHGELTSTREAYDMYSMTAAHKTLPLPSYVRVTNLENQKQVIVKVNDRGPFKAGRIIDLSYAAAHRIDMHNQGTAKVHIETLPPFLSKAPNEINKAVLDKKDFPENSQNYLQIGVYANQNTAHEIQAKLVAILPGYSVLVLNTGKKSSTLYKVRVGPLENFEALEQAQQILMKHHYQNFYLVSE